MKVSANLILFPLSDCSMPVLQTFWNDESGVILSAELVLMCTIIVTGLLVGMVELQCAIVSELSDLGSAFGNLNQSYNHSGFGSSKGAGQFKARTYGAAYSDRADTCDCNANLTIICNDPGEKSGNGGGPGFPPI
jgi:Flp pilus assembly pilin Flp